MRILLFRALLGSPIFGNSQLRDQPDLQASKAFPDQRSEREREAYERQRAAARTVPKRRATWLQ